MVNFFIVQVVVVGFVYWLISSGYLAITTLDRIGLVDAKLTNVTIAIAQNAAIAAEKTDEILQLLRARGEG